MVPNKEITPISQKLVGGYAPASVNAPEVEKAVDYAVGLLNRFDSVDLKVKEIISASEQVVSGLNIKTKFVAVDEYGHEFFVRDVVYSQPWTNTEKLISMSISPELHGHEDFYEAIGDFPAFNIMTSIQGLVHALAASVTAMTPASIMGNVAQKMELTPSSTLTSPHG